MDFGKLIQQRDKFVADAAATLERRGIDRAAIKNPVDLQQEQAGRVRQRLESLERRKAEVVARIDAEMAELKRDLKGREQRIKAEAKDGTPSPGTPPAERAPEPKKTKIAAEPATKKAGLVARAASGKKARPAARKKGK